SSVRCTDFALRAGSEISPRSCSRSIALQSKPFQAVPVVLRLSHSRASTASSILSVSVSVSVRESMRGRIANRAAHGIHDPAVSTYLCYATLRYFRLAPPCAESRRRCYGSGMYAPEGDFAGFPRDARQLEQYGTLSQTSPPSTPWLVGRAGRPARLHAAAADARVGAQECRQRADRRYRRL